LTSGTRYTVRPFRPGDEEGLLELHARAFVGHPPRSRQLWDWKFRDNPVGRTEIALAMDPAGRMVAMYSAIPQRMILDGRDCRGRVAGDQAVDPALRGGLGGSHLILELHRCFREHYQDGGEHLEWGFPDPGVQRVMTKHLQVHVLRDVVLLVRERDPPIEATPGVQVRAVPRFGPETDALWRAGRAEIDTAVIRDRRYLNWRYAEHPDVPHVLLEARSEGSDTLRGLAVLREGGPDPRVVALMDWLVTPGDAAAERALVSRALEETRRRGKNYLVCWFPVPSPQFFRFQREHGFFARSSPFQEAYRTGRPAPTRRWLDEHWYQTLGDFDFF